MTLFSPMYGNRMHSLKSFLVYTLEYYVNIVRYVRIMHEHVLVWREREVINQYLLVGGVLYGSCCTSEEGGYQSTLDDTSSHTYITWNTTSNW